MNGLSLVLEGLDRRDREVILKNKKKEKM